MSRIATSSCPTRRCVAALATAALLGGCSAASGSPDPAPAPQARPEGGSTSDPSGFARLATAPASEGGPVVGFEALVRGTLRVNDANCYAIGDDILIAPAGAEALGDGLGLSVPGAADLRVGDRVTFGGGYFEDAKTLDEYADCVDDSTTGVVFMSDPR